ncbi:hypothetical protein FKP32DRAFT_300253 [Trametes sanguinea]|nr:hypothetical protein FKP32DRAFT_300253 [Trametes sanguinea]
MSMKARAALRQCRTCSSDRVGSIGSSRAPLSAADEERPYSLASPHAPALSLIASPTRFAWLCGTDGSDRK